MCMVEVGHQDTELHITKMLVVQLSVMPFGLEKLGYLEKVEKKGRVISKQGMQKLDRLATEILKEMIVEKPELKIYT